MLDQASRTEGADRCADGKHCRYDAHELWSLGEGDKITNNQVDHYVETTTADTLNSAAGNQHALVRRSAIDTTS